MVLPMIEALSVHEVAGERIPWQRPKQQIAENKDVAGADVAAGVALTEIAGHHIAPVSTGRDHT